MEVEARTQDQSTMMTSEMQQGCKGVSDCRRVTDPDLTSLHQGKLLDIILIMEVEDVLMLNTSTIHSRVHLIAHTR